MIDKSHFKISVIIPTYMPEIYFRRCLDSLENQTLDKSDFRVYIALNGQIHPYKNFVESLLNVYSFSHRLYCLEEVGVSNARNFLIDNSFEPYICFVDDDDVLSANYLESLIAVSSESNVGISHVRAFKENLRYAKSNYIGRSYRSLREVEGSKFKTRKYFSSPCAKMIHRNIIGDVRFDVRLSKGEDALFMAKLSPNVQLIRKATPEACYYVYERPGSSTRKKTPIFKELRRLAYLVRVYAGLLLKKEYKKTFIFTRILASLAQLKKLFR